MAASARDEAERLVAAVIAMAGTSDSSGTRDAVTAGLGSLADSVLGAVGRFTGAQAGEAGSPESARAAEGTVHKPSSGWSTGSAECCVCPVCRAIALVRDPSPQTALKLAAGAGDIATGLASVMRGLSGLAGEVVPRPEPRPAPPPNPDETWSTATRADKAWPGRAPESAAGSGRADRSPESAAGSGRSDLAPKPAASFPTNPKNPAEMTAAGIDPWSAASAADAVAAEEERAAGRAARRKAAEDARAAAEEAARRVAEAAALAEAAKAAARMSAPDTATDAADAANPGGTAGGGDRAGRRGAAGARKRARPREDAGAADAGHESGDTLSGGARSGRTPRRFDVWAAATAEAGVGDVAGPTTVDHDDSGAAAPGERDGAAGDAAPGDGAV